MDKLDWTSQNIGFIGVRLYVLLLLLLSSTFVEGHEIGVDLKVVFKGSVPIVEGTVTVSGLAPDTPLCLYLPYNDPEFGERWQKSGRTSGDCISIKYKHPAPIGDAGP